ncbi:molybdenum cofactor guanylyltransferase MobA [Stutzerimonas nosocomialis]|uniref:Molybdenum cofactor guanylyltransferase n=1 Tax=Stutzerimonas nosocomialis TaxID=1056496 RepID=A0A5R9QI97_9GAMM|nr:molybdenum cofactor guanylyltransferase MobA [Stutzerimonas nosocomialis]TLX64633.1 molybdenum cofactor guanylyltransferase MobA [Stutzerimonas nosocomialis]
MPEHLSPPCSILVLAGGRGQRMGGRDKGLVTWRDKPLIQWVRDVARPLSDDLIISCNRNQERYAAFADRLVGDDRPDFPGPLAGIRAGLAAARHPWLLVIPCDAPLIDDALLSRLHRAAGEADAATMLRRDGQWEPLFCMIPTRFAPQIEQAWLAGGRSPKQVLFPLGVQAVDLDADDRRVANFNSPDLLDQPDPAGT